MHQVGLTGKDLHAEDALVHGRKQLNCALLALHNDLTENRSYLG